MAFELNKALCDEIDNMYEEYINDYHKTPNVAYVEVKWLDNGNTCCDYIGINGVDEIYDEDILFYCNSIEGLKGLTGKGGLEDFIVTKVICLDNID